MLPATAATLLHLDYEKQKKWDLESQETPGVPLSYRLEKMKLVKRRVGTAHRSPGGGKDAQEVGGAHPTQTVVNESRTLWGIPPEAFEYRLGNRSALDWVIDQYQVSTDKRSGITSDPNREDDPKYIVRLVGQVIRVIVETVKIVKALPGEFATA